MAVNAETLNQVIYNYITNVKKFFPIDKAYLYGSYAKGTPTDSSDIDICFFSTYFENRKSVDIMCKLLEIARKYPEFDIEPKAFPLSDIDKGNPFIEEILRTGHEYRL